MFNIALCAMVHLIAGNKMILIYTAQFKLFKESSLDPTATFTQINTYVSTSSLYNSRSSAQMNPTTDLVTIFEYS